MPYDGELANSGVVKRITQNPKVTAFLDGIEKRGRDDVSDNLVHITTDETSASDWLPQYVIGIDGGLQQIPIETGFPGSEVCYNTVVSVLLQIADMAEEDARSRPIPPKRFRELRKAQAIDAVLPGSNIVYKGSNNPVYTFRKQFFETLGANGVIVERESLLQTYERLQARRIGSSTKPQPCPWGDSCAGKCDDIIPAYTKGVGEYKCTCDAKQSLFSTDGLRIHDSFNPHGESGRMFGEAQMAIEHLWLVNVIRALVGNKEADVLDEIAFVMDGPLRIDGRPAWLSQAMINELQDLNAATKAKGGKDLLIFGVEKSGAFVEHLHRLDAREDGGERLPRGWLFLLDNAYIRKYIAIGDRPYGEVTYYGRKFFYKNRTGALLCITVPFLNPGSEDRRQAVNSSLFPRLADILSILDKLASARYPDAIIPIIAAHAEAAIPLSQGKRVLEQLVREHLHPPKPHRRTISTSP
jgi:hypothetical protein